MQRQPPREGLSRRQAHLVRFVDQVQRNVPRRRGRAVRCRSRASPILSATAPRPAMIRWLHPPVKSVPLPRVARRCRRGRHDDAPGRGSSSAPRGQRFDARQRRSPSVQRTSLVRPGSTSCPDFVPICAQRRQTTRSSCRPPTGESRRRRRSRQSCGRPRVRDTAPAQARSLDRHREAGQTVRRRQIVGDAGPRAGRDRQREAQRSLPHDPHAGDALALSRKNWKRATVGSEGRAGYAVSFSRSSDRRQARHSPSATLPKKPVVCCHSRSSEM